MRILVLVDGSKWSQKAALHAIAIAKKKGAKLVLFSVLDRKEAKALAFNMGLISQDLAHVQRFEEKVWEDMKRSIREIMTNLLVLCRDEGVNCSVKITEGSAREKVLEEANSGYSLVVMGAYGRSGKTRIGSLLEEVVGRIEAPVMVVR